MLKIRKEIYSNWPYIFWLGFYFTLFWFIFGANETSFYYVGMAYAISIAFSLSPTAEGLWRTISGVRELATREEKYRLEPLFLEVYVEAKKRDPNLNKSIKLYIQNDMDVNAFAFGRGTLVLTRGSVELLNDDCLKGLIAHEFGHFAHYDTVVILFASIGNLFMSIVMKLIYYVARILLFMVRKKDVTFTIIFKMAHSVIMGIYKGILFVGDLILMSTSRQHEFMADAFASRCGFKQELTEVLYQIHSFSIQNPGSIIEQLRSTHPPFTERIRALELSQYIEYERKTEPTEPKRTATESEKNKKAECGVSSAVAHTDEETERNKIVDALLLETIRRNFENTKKQDEEETEKREAVHSIANSVDKIIDGNVYKILAEIVFEGNTYLYIEDIEYRDRIFVQEVVEDNLYEQLFDYIYDNGFYE